MLSRPESQTETVRSSAPLAYLRKHSVAVDTRTSEAENAD